MKVYMSFTKWISLVCLVSLSVEMPYICAQDANKRPPLVQVLSTIEENGGFGFELHRVTILGTATNDVGKPIANAEIFVGDSGSRRPGGFVPLLGSTISDGQGRFQLDDIQLLVLKQRAAPLPYPAQAEFTLFGVATGYGMTWTSSHRYRTYARPEGKDPADVDVATTESSFYAQEMIDISIHFELEAKLAGRITNDHGEPIANAKIQIGQIDDPRNPNGYGIFRCSYLGDEALGKKPSSFQAISHLPKVYRETRSDQDGYYFLNGLRRDSNYIAAIDPGLEYEPWSFALVTSKQEVNGLQSQQIGYEGEVNHAFEAPRDVFIEVIADDTGAPVKGVTVTAHPNSGLLRSESVCRTDDNGIGLLRLRPNRYTLFAEPDAKVPLVTTRLPLQVSGDASSIRIALPQAAELNIRVLNDQGGSVPDVGFLLQSSGSEIPVPLATQTVFSNYAKTDRLGSLTALVVPGKYKLILDPTSLKNYVPIHSEVDVELAPDMSPPIEFRVDPSNLKPNEISRLPELPEILVRRWTEQSRLARSARLRFSKRNMNQYKPKISPADLLSIAENFNEKAPDSLLQQLEDKLGQKLRLPLGNITIDGIRCREEWSKTSATPPDRDPSSAPDIELINLFNGKESLQYSSSNHQIDLFGANKSRSVSVTSIPDLVQIHFAEQFLAPRVELNNAKIRTVNDRLVIQLSDESRAAEFVYDSETGMLLKSRTEDSRNKSARNDFLFLPEKLPDGLVLPRARLHWDEAQGQVTSFRFELIDSVESFDELPPETFSLEATYGAMIVDYRNQVDNRPGGIEQSELRSSVRDVISYLNLTTVKTATVETRPEYGKPAPKIEVSEWYRPDGDSHAPSWAGNILLIEFWGMSCGPCIGSIPQVREATNFFADKKVTVLSIHESGTTIEELRNFSAKHKINYPIGIDRPSIERGWFGESMRSYGVRGIPSAAVVNADGELVFVGDLMQALQTIDNLSKK